MLTMTETNHARRASDVFAGNAINASSRVRTTDRHHKTCIEIQPDNSGTVSGVEIQISGLTAHDDFRAYPLNYLSTVNVTYRERMIVLLFESAGRSPIREFSQSTKLLASPVQSTKLLASPVQSTKLLASPDADERANYFWMLTLTSESGADRIGVEISARAISVAYRWRMITGEIAEAICASQQFALD